MKYWYLLLAASWGVFKGYQIVKDGQIQSESSIHEQIGEYKTFNEARVKAKQLGDDHGGITELQDDFQDPFLGNVLVFIVRFVALPGQVLDGVLNGVLETIITVVNVEKLDEYDPNKNNP